jgi:hypothetical protein
MPERGLLRLTDDAVNGLGNGGVMQPYTWIVVLAVVPVLIDTLLLDTYIRGGVHHERAWWAATV